LTYTHHIDIRADQVRNDIARLADDVLVNTRELATMLSVSTQFLEIGRHKGYGPAFVKVEAGVRYRMRDVRAWLDQRTESSTARYAQPSRRKAIEAA
jgi:hypothetical protein